MTLLASLCRGLSSTWKMDAGISLLHGKVFLTRELTSVGQGSFEITWQLLAGFYFLSISLFSVTE